MKLLIPFWSCIIIANIALMLREVGILITYVVFAIVIFIIDIRRWNKRKNENKN